MRILNLTQHPATLEQIAAGVEEPVDKAAVQKLLTFDTLPSVEDIAKRAGNLAAMVREHDAAMIGGAGYLMGPLEYALRELGVVALHAFSVRESVESVQADGSVKKTQVFRHAGFVG